MTTTVILPAGLHELGFAEGVDFVSTASPPAILADKINATTGALESLLTGNDPVDAAVIHIARTRRGSGAATADIGHRLHEIQKNDERAPDLARSYVREMFQEMTQDGRIEIHDIDTTQFGTLSDGLGIFMDYTNLRSGARLTVGL